MARAIIGVIVGYAIWTCIWLGGNAVLLPDAAKVVGEGQFYGDAGPLAIALVLSVVCSLAAGIVTTSIARPMHRMRCGIVLSIALLLTGIGVQTGVWNLMPAWYHISFLVLLVPMTLVGAKLRGTR
ncbi:MAG: hypothetical protein H6815_02975 [Phycisphaeraceae bacterium]|nr:hypothetical protein [Phycisphaerales bacterium]MCB9859390.1 hypothetical protein [Phycisphaeraceae bacterium]